MEQRINGLRYSTDTAKLILDVDNMKMYQRKTEPKYFFYYPNKEVGSQIEPVDDKTAAEVAARLMPKEQFFRVFQEQEEVTLLLKVPKMVKDSAKELKKRNSKWTLSEIFTLGLDHAWGSEAGQDNETYVTDEEQDNHS